MFGPIARYQAADITNGCQIMSYTHVEKDLTRTEHLNLNIEKNTS